MADLPVSEPFADTPLFADRRVGDHAIRTAAERDLPQAAAVLAEAFSADPVMAALLPSARDRRERLSVLFEALLRSGAYRTGRVDLVADDQTGEILGVAAWEGPGAQRGALGRQVAHVGTFLRALGWRGVIRGVSIFGRFETSRPVEPHWYLAEIGVSEAARGRGVGSALLRAQLRVLDLTRQIAYLESSTPENRRLYRRAGFVELHGIDGVPGARPAAMIRHPRTVPAGATSGP